MEEEAVSILCIWNSVTRLFSRQATCIFFCHPVWGFLSQHSIYSWRKWDKVRCIDNCFQKPLNDLVWTRMSIWNLPLRLNSLEHKGENSRVFAEGQFSCSQGILNSCPSSQVILYSMCSQSELLGPASASASQPAYIPTVFCVKPLSSAWEPFQPALALPWCSRESSDARR